MADSFRKNRYEDTLLDASGYGYQRSTLLQFALDAEIDPTLTASAEDKERHIGEILANLTELAQAFPEYEQAIVDRELSETF